MKKTKVIRFLIQSIISVLSAVLTALGTTSCMG
ncbi:MAG: smalltalk protein [Prevotella sp.]|nr:smalltalk protein [Prevotella sp.]